MKTKKETIDISTKWETQLPLYLEIYPRLNEKGKKEARMQVGHIGKLIDRMQIMRKEKENA